MPQLPATRWLAVAASAALLCACDGGSRAEHAGRRIDAAATKLEAKTEAALADANRRAEQLARQVEAQIDDATITASINAQLAADKSLSALRINVDTTKGRVRLTGTASDNDAKRRATALATAVKGVVVRVDNELKLVS